MDVDKSEVIRRFNAAALNGGAHVKDLLPEPPGETPVEVSKKKPNPTIYTDTELAAMDLPPAREVVPGLFGAGHYILSGAPKMGKSFLVMSIATGLAWGKYVLGKIPVEPADVLYICLEDGLRRTARRLKQRADEHGTSGRLHFAFEWPGLGEGGLGLLDIWLTAHPGGVFFIDTGKRLRNEQDDEGRSFYSSDYDFIAPLTDLCHAHDTLGMTVWHDRKLMAEDFFDQINASRGLTAAVDGVAQLSRERGSRSGKLSIGDRDTEDRAFSLDFDSQLLGWTLGEQVDVQAGKGDPLLRVLSAIRTLDSDLGVSVEMIETELGDISVGTIRNYLTRLRQQKAIRVIKPGRFRPAQEEDTPPE